MVSIVFSHSDRRSVLTSPFYLRHPPTHHNTTFLRRFVDSPHCASLSTRERAQLIGVRYVCLVSTQGLPLGAKSTDVAFRRATLGGPFAEITVGAGGSATIFNLPKQLLCDSSTFFKAALNNGFAETATQKLTLDEDDPKVFRTYAT